MVVEKFFTDEVTKKIVDAYVAEPTRATVDSLADELNRSYRSIIAKLSAEGVYQVKERTTKTGEPIVKKEQLVADIEAWLGISVPTLAKTGKQELILLHRSINDRIHD